MRNLDFYFLNGYLPVLCWLCGNILRKKEGKALWPEAVSWLIGRCLYGSHEFWEWPWNPALGDKRKHLLAPDGVGWAYRKSVVSSLMT